MIATPQPQQVELECTICLRPFLGAGKRENRVGPKPDHADCWSARDRIAGILRRVREDVAKAQQCPFCSAKPAKGSKFCGKHQFRRCERCPNLMRRNEGQGNQPRLCKTCRGGGRRSFSGSAAGGAGR